MYKTMIRLLTLFVIMEASAYAAPLPDNMLTLGYPENIASVEFGHLQFGVETPRIDGQAEGLNFTIKEVKPEADGSNTVFGMGRHQGIVNQVWRASTKDGRTFTDNKLLYQLPKLESRWLRGEVTRKNDQLLVLQCRNGGYAGHPFHVFSGSIDGTGWRQLKSDPVFTGQDGYSIGWDEDKKQYIGHMISFQPWKKRHADNMPAVRRVFLVRTSPDGVTWTPSGSFGVRGPHLPVEQLILPDEKDAPDTEFYDFAACDLGEFWLGTMTHYASQPAYLPRPGRVHHGPFTKFEWWISKDGVKWDRPFRDDLSLDAVPFNFCKHFCSPMVIGDELCWALPTTNRGMLRYLLNTRRLCYAYGRENLELVTKPFTLSGKPMTLEVSFESVRRKAESFSFQGYVMAELLDEQGQVIPGFERKKCMFHASSKATRLTLAWDGKQLPDNATGKKVSLRILFRDTRLYSLSY